MRILPFLVVGLALTAQPLLGQDGAPLIRWQRHHLEVPVLVSWESTRSDSDTEGFASHTEHFREIWYFVVEPGTTTYLRSPRAQVATTGIGYPTKSSEVPKEAVLSEDDFAKLLGITLPPPSETHSDSNLLMSLKLLAADTRGEDFVLHLSPEDFVSLHFELSL